MNNLQFHQSMAEKEPGVKFVGRLASYKYFNMDQVNFNPTKSILVLAISHKRYFIPPRRSSMLSSFSIQIFEACAGADNVIVSVKYSIYKSCEVDL